jgi:oligopeptide transport system substrate-binding protein
VLTTQRPVHRIGIFRYSAFVIVFVMVAASCSVPFLGDDDASDNGAPAAATPDAPAASPTPDQRDQPVVDQRDDDWTVISAPPRRDPPDSLRGEQVLRLNGSTDGPSTLDPALVRDTTSAFLVRQIFRGLVRINNDMEAVPDLAERVEISPDGKTYRFTLHEGLTFHDGRPITASAIKASLERATAPTLVRGESGTLPSRNYLDDIEGALERMAGERDDIPGIVVVDDRTLEISLVRGVVDFLERLANPVTYVVDVETAEYQSDWWRSPNGSGPFRVAEWDPDRVLVLVPHDGYIQPPFLSEVRLRMGREAVGEVRLYETGEIDVAGLPTSVIDRFDYDGSPFVQDVRSVPLYSTTFAMINRNIEPFDDDRLRQALMHAFPREKIPGVMLDGRAQDADGVLPPGMLTSDGFHFPYEFDPDTAAALLADLRPSDDGEAVTIYTSGGSIPAAMKQLYEEHLQIEVEVVQLRWQDYLDDLDQREMPFFVISWVADGPDPVAFLRALFHSDSPDNYVDYADQDVDRLLDDAAVERDDDRRMELVREAHDRILDSAVVMPLFHGVDYQLIAGHVHGLQLTPMGILGLETVWIEQ